MNRKNQKDREQLANILLVSPKGEDLIISSPIHSEKDASSWFTAREDRIDGASWKISFKIVEI